MADIWWADVARACAALGVRDSVGFAAVARLLGFDVAIDAPATVAVPALAEPGARLLPLLLQLPGSDIEGAPGTTPSAVVEQVLLEPVDEEPLVGTLPPGAVLSRTHVDRPAPLPAHPPLLSPRSAGGIVQYLLSRQIADGEVDIAALLEAIAAGRPPVALTRKPQRTLRFGAQVLLDLSEQMRLFRRDQNQVTEIVRAVVGSASTDVLYFADVPTRGAGVGPRWKWRDYKPPPPGSRVLLLTDFGIGGGQPRFKHVDEWLVFLDRLRSHGCWPVALVPYPPARWPSRILTHCPMCRWDRGVTVGQARMVMA